MHRIIFPLKERPVSLPLFELRFNVWVFKKDPAITIDKDWFVFVSPCRTEPMDVIKDDTIRNIPLIVCMSNSFVKMKLRKKMNDKRLFPAFYRTKKTQLSKRQNKTRNCCKHPGFKNKICMNIILKQFEPGVCQM